MSAPAAPLVEAALEPGPVRFHELPASGVVDAEVVEAAAADESGESPAVVRWPCRCGMSVPIETDVCPACGSLFLEDVREVPAGRHRGGKSGLLLSGSRRMRLTLAGVFAALLAVGIPLLLALLG